MPANAPWLLSSRGKLGRLIPLEVGLRSTSRSIRLERLRRETVAIGSIDTLAPRWFPAT